MPVVSAGGWRRPHASLVVSLAALAAPALPLLAQEGTGSIAGRVTEAGPGTPVAGASVRALTLTNRVVAGSVNSSEDGRYRLAGLAAGRYAVVVSRIGYRARRVDTVTVRAGETATVNVAIEALPSQLNQVVTTASRGQPEKILEAPASISVVTSEEIGRKQSVTVADLVRGQPGIDATQGGLAQSNVVARGFNNAFSGSLLMLQDYRFAGVPSLRVNVPFLFTGTNDDIDRVEVLLGPAAALYGPNSANGVMHIITKSPFNSPGTTLSVDGGERSLFRLSGRHAGTIGEKVGFKVSGEYFRANDFEYRDPGEPTTFGATAPAARRGQRNERDFGLERYTGEARLDLRPTENTEAITTIGYTDVANAIELTGANGASQIRNWTYTNLQQRFRWKRLFAQAFMNISDAGNRDSLDTRGTFLLRSGQPIVDQSRVAVAQVQHAFDLGARSTVVYGGDYIYTNPRTSGTTHGLNEGIDNVAEYGAYAQSTTRFSPKWELTAAARLDRNDQIDGVFFSPRASLAFKPNTTSNWRVSFNRAFQTPGVFQMYLDLVQASTPAFNIRATGVNPNEGIRFARSCANGVGGLCMRTSNLIPAAAGGPNRSTDANAAGFFPLFIGLANANNALVTGVATTLQQAGLPAAQAAQIAGTVVQRLATAQPTTQQVGTLLRNIAANNAVVPTTFVQDIEPLKASFVNNYETGYKGIIGERLRLAVDGWYQQRVNFITPAQLITPTVFVDPTTLGAFIAQNVATTAAGAGLPAAAAQSLGATLAQRIAGAVAPLPIGNVVPQGRLYERNDLIFAYRTVDRTINLWGSDLAADLVVSPRVTLAGTYSFVSDQVFPEIPGGNGQPLRLNAPQHKASVAYRFQDEPRGFGWELRYRYADLFRVNSAVYVGTVPVQSFVDASVNYTFSVRDQRVRWSLNGTNILDRQTPTFIGTPDIGRLVTTRVSYSF